MILSVCNVPEVLKVMKIVKVVLLILRIAVPIILIVFAMLDFAKAVTSPDGDGLHQSIKIAVKRTIVAVIIFLLPTIISIVFNVVAPNIKYKDCFDNATDERIEALYISTMDSLLNEARATLSDSSAKASTAYSALANARNYVKNIENEELYNNYVKELDSIEKQMDQKYKK